MSRNLASSWHKRVTTSRGWVQADLQTRISAVLIICGAQGQDPHVCGNFPSDIPGVLEVASNSQNLN